MPRYSYTPDQSEERFSWWDFMRSIWFFLESHRARFLFWTAVLFTVFFHQLVPPIIIARIIDFFTSYKPGDSLTPFYTLVALIAGIHGIASIIRLTAKNRIAELGTELNYRVKVDGFERLSDFSVQWHDKENTGNKVQRIQNGVVAFGDFRRLMSQDGFQTLAAIIGIVAVFIFMSPQFVLFLAVYLVVFFCINASFYATMVKTQNEFNKVREQASGTYYEGLNNMLTIKTLGAKDSFRKNIRVNEKQAKEQGYRLISLGMNKYKAFQVFNALCIGVYLLMVGNDLIRGSITIGSVYIFHNYLMKLIDAAATSTDIFERLIEIKSAIGRMMPIYWDTEATTNGHREFPSHWQEIRIDKGTFSYRGDEKGTGDDPFELHELDFRIRRGEKVGIAGASGSGKSTLAKLLLGLYQLKSGAFTVDGNDFYQIRHTSVTHKIAIVLQENEMFNLSFRDNITLLKSLNPSLFEKAIRIARLEDVVKKMTDGLDTKIGEKGYRLSGGERQRIGIARAIYKDPQMFVLDEATSALDGKTEEQIQTALEKELSDKTMIIIAHRITTLKNVDRICVFEKGRIVEQGTYRQLLADPHSKLSRIARMKDHT